MNRRSSRKRVSAVEADRVSRRWTMNASTCSRLVAVTSVGIPARAGSRRRSESIVLGDLFSASCDERHEGVRALRSDTLAAVTRAALVVPDSLGRRLRRCETGVQRP